MLCAIH